VFDNLSRKGASTNIEWLTASWPILFKRGDIRNFEDVVSVFQKYGPFDLILHLAGQVAVTTSVIDPREDFEVNALGTFNLLEAVRQYNPESTIIYASTNKVYGDMEDLDITEKNGRYMYLDMPEGVGEDRNLVFHSPYGCSKGAADQYCTDYNRIYNIKTIVLRQSCIYGYRQFGIEDQGWVAWFCIAAVTGKKITVFGDGKQVRDVLFIDDLLRAFELAYENRYHTAGRVYNIGGGPNSTLSLHELIEKLEKFSGEKIPLEYNNWRPGDQKVFIGNISRAEAEFGWRPEIDPDEGVEKLYRWAVENKTLFT
jgi:CDP-paratose 2-epimerase